MRLHLAPAPPALAAAGTIALRGRRPKGDTYAEHAAEAERCARLLVAAFSEERALRGEPPAGSTTPFGAPAPEGPFPGLILGCTPGLLPAVSRPWPRAIAAVCLEAHGAGAAFEPQRSRGLASAEELIEAARRGSLIAAGAAGVVALNCARAAYLVGPGDEPALRRGMLEAGIVAVDALEARWRFLESALYRRPRLPLWETEGASVVREAAPPWPGLATSTKEPPGEALMPAELAVHVVALVGLEEALVRVLGESPAANPDVAIAAGELVRDLDRRLREEGARRGLRVRIEEPEVERGRRRLADEDLGRHKDMAERTLRCTPQDSGSGDVRYKAGLGGALVGALYAPLRLAPFVEGGDLRGRGERLALAAQADLGAGEAGLIGRGAAPAAAPVAPATASEGSDGGDASSAAAGASEGEGGRA